MNLFVLSLVLVGYGYRLLHVYWYTQICNYRHRVDLGTKYLHKELLGTVLSKSG